MKVADAFLGGNLSRRTVIWLIPILLAIHNAEEAVAFTRMQRHLVLPEPFATLESRLSYPVLLQVLATLSIVGFMLAAFVALRPQARGALWLLLALEAAVAINAVAHIASAIVIFHGYAPGLLTAVLLNVPFAVYALGRAKREAWVSARAWVTLWAGGAILHGPILIGALWVATR
ncbi:MAG: HXXEE domain-containing protein [Gemmatimonadaceae bacterium]